MYSKKSNLGLINITQIDHFNQTLSTIALTGANNNLYYNYNYQLYNNLSMTLFDFHAFTISDRFSVAVKQILKCKNLFYIFSLRTRGRKRTSCS